MSIKAMKQALEALEYDTRLETEYGINSAITILRQAIAEAEKQEPVAWRYQDARGHYRYVTHRPDVAWAPNDILKPIPLYTHPPKREWVGLTDEQIWELSANCL